MSYSPIPGSIPAQAIAYLEAKPAGYAASSAEINDAIGQPSATNLSAFLITAKKHGAVRASKKEGLRATFWSLGDGTPEPADEDNDPDEADQAQQRWIGKVRSPSQPASPLPTAAPPSQAPTQTRPPGDHATQFMAGLLLDGSMVVHHRGQRLVFTSTQTALLAQVAVAATLQGRKP